MKEVGKGVGGGGLCGSRSGDGEKTLLICRSTRMHEKGWGIDCWGEMCVVDL